MISCFNVHAGLLSWGDSTLVTVGEEQSSSEDFKNWWKFWQEKDQPLPQTPEPYIDWLLFAQDAERMVLFDDPSYQRDMNIYLKVLSLEQLRHDEVTSKISITEDEVEKKYNEFYVPVWLCTSIIIKDKATADHLYDDLQSGKMEVADLIQIAARNEQILQGHLAPAKTDDDLTDLLKKYPGPADTLLGVQQNSQKRPYSSDKIWVEVLSGLAKGAFSKPFAWQENYIITQLVDIFPGDKEDFERQKNGIRKKIQKGQAGALTNNLIERLKVKHGVTINEERLNAINPESTDVQYSAEPLITIGAISVSEQQVMAMVAEDIQNNKKYGFTGMDAAAVLQRVVNGIISQTLITKESLDRHYEVNNASIKALFLFKSRHSLVKKLENQIREKSSAVSEDQISFYYQEHKDEFTSPDIFQMVLLNGPEEDLKKVWLDVVINGKELIEVAESRMGMKPTLQSYPANHLDPEVLRVVKGLTKGDVSQVFPVNNTFSLVKLSGHVPSETAPLEIVRSAIQKRIAAQQYEKTRNEYLKGLKEKTSIEVNEKTWMKIKKELNERQ